MDRVQNSFFVWPTIVDNNLKLARALKSENLILPTYNEKIIPILSEARHFLFSDKFMEMKAHKTALFDIDNDIISMPFKVCAFELFSTQFNLQYPSKMKMDFFVVRELAPLNFEFICHTVVDGKPTFRYFDYSHYNPEKDNEYSSLCVLTFELCNFLKSDETAIGSLSKKQTKQKIKLNNINTFYRPKPVVVCVSKSEKSLNPKHLESVDWSHRWEVRGHWRAISGLGKDRDGNYNIRNFTWVSPHIKGPEEKELIIKTRIKLKEKNVA